MSCFDKEAVWISQQTGHVKPRQGAFTQTDAWRSGFEKSIFIDDMPANISASRRWSLPALLADVGWSDEVDVWLHRDNYS